MKELTLKEIQEIDLNLLLEFDRICRENRLRYSLGGGTLIGAVRHKGFIPWDNDADVFMPRPDYDRLMGILKNNEYSFNVFNRDTVPGCYILWTRFSDRDTVYKRLVEDEMKDLGLGCFLDIVPIDGIGASPEKYAKMTKKIRYLTTLLYLTPYSKHRLFWGRTLKHKICRIRNIAVSRILGPERLYGMIFDILKDFDYETSEYVTSLGSYEFEKFVYRKEIFEEYEETEFEGHKFMRVKDYDTLLRKQFGDYMQLPPVEKRGAHHCFTFYRKDG